MTDHYDPMNARRIEESMAQARLIPGTILQYRDGSIIRYFNFGQLMTARVTSIYPTMDPPRFDAVLVNDNALDATKASYPDEGGQRVWGYEAMIREVVRP